MAPWIFPIVFLIGIFPLSHMVWGNPYKYLTDREQIHPPSCASLDPFFTDDGTDDDTHDAFDAPFSPVGSMVDDDTPAHGGADHPSHHGTGSAREGAGNSPQHTLDFELTYLSKQLRKTTQSLADLEREPWLQAVWQHLWFSDRISPAYNKLLTAYHQGTEHVQLPLFFQTVIDGDYPVPRDADLPLYYGSSFLYQPGVRDQLIACIERDIEPALGSTFHMDPGDVGRLLVDSFSLHDYLIILRNMIRHRLIVRDF